MNAGSSPATPTNMQSKHFSVSPCACFHIGQPGNLHWMNDGKHRKFGTYFKAKRLRNKLIGHLDDRLIGVREVRMRTKIFYCVASVADSLEGKYRNRKRWKVLMNKWWNRTAKWNFSNNEL